MSAVTVGRRLADRILIIPTWQRVCSEFSYVPSPKPSLHDTFGGHNFARTFATILYEGLWLQRAVAEKLPVAKELATNLSAYADLKSNNYEDSRRERVGAAFLLWSFHSARYYGYLKATKAERLKSRQSLCDIQAILYNNVRTFLDNLRLWFDCYDDLDLRCYVTDRMMRARWRPEKLTQHTPDLCAADCLVDHLLEVMKAKPLVRRAIQGIQDLSVGRTTAGDPCAAVLQAFTELRVSQMTVFYHPNPVDVKEADELPLYELVHEMRDTDDVPEKLIPFDNDPKLARNFRKLANTIYTASDENQFPNFLYHRRRTIDQINETTSFISDGSISNHFLTTKPPVKLSVNGDPDSNSSAKLQSLWPLWYSHALTDIDPEVALPDWSNEFWWSNISREQLKESLFPGPQTHGSDLHKNDHLSAYWDNLVYENQQFLDRIEIPEQHPTGNPSFGYLMELLLRREKETRTSFFFALAQTYDSQKPRLCQFVGGTFLGLERPGIPFAPARFEALAARVRGLVMAVAHFSTTQALKLKRIERAKKRGSFNLRVDTIIELLKGEGQFDRSSYLLFASPDANVPNTTDHDYFPRTAVGWKPSRYQIKSVFETASHLIELSATSPFGGATCSDTWKALLYLGGTVNIHNKLSRFLRNWARYQGQSAEGRPSDMADRAVVCDKCFRAALEFLLSREIYQDLSDKIQVSDEPIILPTRPGIRFLIALCRFIVDIQSQASPENTNITGITFTPYSVLIDFDKPKLLKAIWAKHGMREPNLIHTTGIFESLRRSEILDLPQYKKDKWDDFLTSETFARLLTLEPDSQWQQLIMGWAQ